MDVLQLGERGVEVGAGDELDVLVVGGHFEHVVLEAVGVVDDELAALFGQFDVGVLTGGVLADVVLDHPVDVDALGGQSLGGGVLAADKVVGVALIVFIADADEADLDGLALGGGRLRSGGLGGGFGFRGGAGPAAGGQRQGKGSRQEQRQILLVHVQKFLLTKFPFILKSLYKRPHGRNFKWKESALPVSAALVIIHSSRPCKKAACGSKRSCQCPSGRILSRRSRPLSHSYS